MAGKRKKALTNKKKAMAAALSLGALPLFYAAATAVVFVKRIASPVISSITDTPSSLGLAYEDVTFVSRVDKLKLRGRYIRGGSHGTVIFVHGGKSNRTAGNLLPIAGDLSKSGFNILMFDRRDCGESDLSKRKDRSCLERDVAGAYDFAKAVSDPSERIFIYGSSMGALAAIVFASECADAQGIVVESCFANTPETLKRVFGTKAPRFSFLVPGMLVAARTLYGIRKFSAIDYIGSVSSPVLFIQGDRDDTVPVEDAYKLLRASTNPANRVWIIEGAEHSGGYNADPRRYVDRIAAFFLAATT
jgi:uncharacterized protein